MYQPTGKHCIVEGTGCDFNQLNDQPRLEQLLAAAAGIAGATVLIMDGYQFDPQGVTVFGVLSESHISIHTYPEAGAFMADIFTCGNQCDPEAAGLFLIDRLKPSLYDIQVLARGTAA